MKLAIDARELEGNPTGAGRVLLEYLCGWPAAFFDQNEVTLLFKNEIPCLDDLPAACRRVRLRAFSDLVWEIFLLPLYLRRNGADLFWGANGAGAFSCSRRTRQVISVYDLTYVFRPGDYGLKERLVRRFRVGMSLKRASALLTLSESAKEDLQRLRPSLSGKITVTAPGADAFAALYRRDRTKTNLLYVGSLLNRRPIAALVRMAALLVRRYPGLILTLAGENRTRPHRDFHQLVRQLGLEGRVVILDYVTEQKLKELYEDAGIFCYPSFYEGFGLPVIEAQAAGLPVMTLKNSSLWEVGGETVAYAREGTAEAMAETVFQLLEEPLYYETLQRAGQENARRFSWKKGAETVLNVLIGESCPKRTDLCAALQEARAR